ncbi:MAG: hypothetical protein RBT81_00505 [Gammaproteobacteria bacterium]|jgi:hypothetical protein|nr:hypothetical protein [Gammaproteobacteria bacterium]
METSIDDGGPKKRGIIEVRIQELRKLFDAMDPSPFHSKDLHPTAEEYIVGSARELPARIPLTLVLHVDQSAAPPEEERIVGDAIHAHFFRQAELARLKLRMLLRRGWISLAIGITFLVAALVGSASVMRLLGEGTLATVFRESLMIGGWVAMWRPLEMFLYDWWPLLGERRFHQRLGRMPVRITYRD